MVGAPGPRDQRQTLGGVSVEIMEVHTPLSKLDAIFMDMFLSIMDEKIESIIYGKDLTLYVCIIPSCMHPSGVLGVLIMVLLISQLCDMKSDIQMKLAVFMGRLLDQGHQSSNLLPLFNIVILNATNYLAMSEDDKVAAKVE